MKKIFLYVYKIADGGEYFIVSSSSPDEIGKLLSLFKKSVRDAAYLDCNKFVPFLRKRGIDAEEITEHNLISW